MSFSRRRRRTRKKVKSDVFPHKMHRMLSLLYFAGLYARLRSSIALSVVFILFPKIYSLQESVFQKREVVGRDEYIFIYTIGVFKAQFTVRVSRLKAGFILPLLFEGIEC